MADQICYAVLCVFSYVAAGKGNNTLKPQQLSPKPAHSSHTSHAGQAVKQTHLPQQSSPKLQSIISKPQTSPQQKPIPQMAPPPMTTQAEAVQPPTNLPTIPARRPSQTSPPSSEPPKIQPPTLPTTTIPVISSQPIKVQTQGSTTSARGPPPAIPPRTPGLQMRSGSVQVSSPPSTGRMVRRQSSTSQMPQCTPQAPPAFVIPQRRGSITKK